MPNTNAYTSGVPAFLPGTPISASALERLREADQRTLPQRSVGTFVSQKPSGTIITPIQRRRSASSHPFRVFDVSDAEGTKITVQYGAVIDMSDWQEPKIHIPRISNQELPASLTEEFPKLNVPNGNSKLCIVIQQGENGEIDNANNAVRIEVFPNKMPNSIDGTLYILIAELSAKKNAVSIRQILASQIIWPIKPDFLNWRHKKQNSLSALWIGGGTPYTQTSDILSDLFIEIRRVDFDNGRDGDLPFALRMQKGKNFELTFDRDNMRGFECSMNDNETNLILERKNTTAAGIQLRSNNNESSSNILGPGEGSTVITTSRKDQCNMSFSALASSIIVEASDKGPKMEMAGKGGSTTVTTVAGKEIAMREVTFMISATESQKAYFLCSQLETSAQPTDSKPAKHTSHHLTQHTANYRLHHVSAHNSQHKNRHGIHHAGHTQHSQNSLQRHNPHHTKHSLKHHSKVHDCEHEYYPPHHPHIQKHCQAHHPNNPCKKDATTGT